MKKRRYSSCFKNCWFVITLWSFSVSALLICIGFISIPSQMWVILLIACLAICLIIISLFVTLAFRCKIDYDGITTIDSHLKKKQLLWSEINSIKIMCSNTYVRYYIAYMLEFKSKDIAIKLISNKNVVDKIKIYSKECESFQSIFLDRLKDAESSY